MLSLTYQHEAACPRTIRFEILLPSSAEFGCLMPLDLQCTLTLVVGPQSGWCFCGSADLVSSQSVAPARDVLVYSWLGPSRSLKDSCSYFSIHHLIMICGSHLIPRFVVGRSDTLMSYPGPAAARVHGRMDDWTGPSSTCV